MNGYQGLISQFGRKLVILKTSTKRLPLLNAYYEKYKALERGEENALTSTLLVKYHFQSRFRLTICS